MAEMTDRQRREMRAIEAFKREEAANASNERAGNSNASSAPAPTVARTDGRTKAPSNGMPGKTKVRTDAGSALTGRTTADRINQALR